MSKKELSIKINYLSMVFNTLKADELIRKVLGLPLEYFMIQKAKVKHKDYTNLYQFGTIKVYGDRQSKDGTSEAGCYLILSGQGCDDYYSFLQTSKHTYSDFFNICLQIVGRGNFHLTRFDIAIDDKNEIPYFTIEQIKRKCLKDEFVSKSKSYRFAESSFDEDTAKTVYIGDGKSNISYRFYDKDKEQAGKYQLTYEEIENWKRTELQLRDEMAHSFAMLMCETLEELGNLAFDLLSSSLHYTQTFEVYGCEDCSGCEHKERCLYKYDAEKNKIMKINEQWESLREESHANIQSEKGILNRQIRSIQTEGHFGDIKENEKFRRFNYRSSEKVYKEFMLYAIGRNINKYHRFLHDEIQKFEGKTDQKTA